jgi:serine/threonine-protein kinase RsbW
VPASTRVARERLGAFIGELGLGTDDRLDILTAVGEALANAIEHAGSARPIGIAARLEDDALVVEVVDRGQGFRGPGLACRDTMPADVMAERGRGLAIMRRSALCTIRSSPGNGTLVRLVRRLRSELPAPRSFARRAER